MKDYKVTRFAGVAVVALAAPAIAQQTADRTPVKTIMDGTFTVNGIITLMAALAGFIGLWLSIRKFQQDNAKEQQEREDRLLASINKHQDSVENRLTRVETKVADFMPRAEIENKVEHVRAELESKLQHERNNRTAADDASARMHQRHDADILELKVGIGKLEQKQDGTAATVLRVEELIKEMSRDQGLKMEKLQDCLTSLSRKAA